MNLPTKPTSDVGLLTGSPRQTNLVLIIFGAIGVLFNLLGRLVIPPPSVLQKALEPKQAPWMAPVQQFWGFLGSVEGSLAAFGVFALFAVYIRYQARALFSAFIAGVYLATALIR